MTDRSHEAIDAIAVWVEQNSKRTASDSVQLTLQQGRVPDGSRRKATLSLEAGEKVALIETWSSGEMDFTMHDFSVSEDGTSTHIRFATFEDLTAAIDRCYAQFMR
jgi:hypothetical protein